MVCLTEVKAGHDCDGVRTVQQGGGEREKDGQEGGEEKQQRGDPAPLPHRHHPGVQTVQLNRTVFKVINKTSMWRYLHPP